MKWAIDVLHYYWLGTTFTLVMDHALLQWLHSMKDTSPHIMQWYLSIQPYDFRVQH